MQRQELLTLLNLSKRGAISPELNEILDERRAVFEQSCLVWLWDMERRSGHPSKWKFAPLSSAHMLWYRPTEESQIIQFKGLYNPQQPTLMEKKQKKPQEQQQRRDSFPRTGRLVTDVMCNSNQQKHRSMTYLWRQKLQIQINCITQTHTLKKITKKDKKRGRISWRTKIHIQVPGELTAERSLNDKRGRERAHSSQGYSRLVDRTNRD